MTKQPSVKKFFRTKRGRKISIEINDEHITFYNINGSTLYWLLTSDWIADKTERTGCKSNWHNHMMDKHWFTTEMMMFINNNTK